MSARWRCKQCGGFGLGGPDGFVRHHERVHAVSYRASSSESFGFLGRKPTSWGAWPWSATPQAINALRGGMAAPTAEPSPPAPAPQEHTPGDAA